MLREIMIHYLTYTCRFIPYFRSLPTSTAVPVNVFSAYGRLNFESLSLHPVMAAYVVPPSSYAYIRQQKRMVSDTELNVCQFKGLSPVVFLVYASRLRNLHSQVEFIKQVRYYFRPI